MADESRSDPPSQENDRSNSDKQPANTDGNAPQKCPPAAINPEKKERDWQDRAELGLLFFTFIAAVIAAVAGYKAAIYTGDESRTSKEALHHAKLVATLQNRAYAYVKNIGLRPYPPQKPTHFGLDFDIVNSGRTPARNITMRRDCLYLPSGIDPWSSGKWNKLASGPIPPIGGHCIVCKPTTHGRTLLKRYNQ